MARLLTTAERVCVYRGVEDLIEASGEECHRRAACTLGGRTGE
jgi:hypothetical protein